MNVQHTKPHRLFYDHEPTNWKELETMAFQAFQEMGYEASLGKKVESVRGSVAIDVQATKKSSPIPMHYLCECKHWNKKISQDVVHAFRTVCGDVGTHCGLIISKKGFQKGAKESAISTNIHLLNFQEFQDTFFEEWKTGVCMELSKMSGNLAPLLNADLLRKYEIFLGYENYYVNFFILNKEFPVSLVDPRGALEITETIEIKSFREYYELAKQGYQDALKHLGISSNRAPS